MIETFSGIWIKSNFNKFLLIYNLNIILTNKLKDFVEAFHSNLQSTHQVSTRLSKLNDLMDSFGTVQDDIIELDEG